MKIFNKRASFDYELGEKFEAGIALTGGEAKAVREKHASLSQTYAKILGGEVFLINASIPVTGAKDHNPTRSRKLLLHKKEIYAIQAKTKAKNLTLVPVSLYTKGRLTKVQLALGKPKKQYEKREALKKASIKREVEKLVRGKI